MADTALRKAQRTDNLSLVAHRAMQAGDLDTWYAAQKQLGFRREHLTAWAAYRAEKELYIGPTVVEYDLLEAYRASNPRSRAQRICRFVVNTGVRRQLGCVLCGEEGPGWAGAWPRTQRSITWELSHVREHLKECQELGLSPATYVEYVSLRNEM